MPAGIGAVPGTTETMSDLGSAFSGGRGGGGVEDPSGNTMSGPNAIQERVQGVSRILNQTAAKIGEHAKGLGTIATQFPMAGKRLKTAIDHLEKAQQDLVTAITDVVREAQTNDQQNAPAVVR